ILQKTSSSKDMSPLLSEMTGSFQAQEFPKLELATLHHASYGEAHRDLLPQLPGTKRTDIANDGSILFRSDSVSITQRTQWNSRALRMQNGAFTLRKLTIGRSLLRPRIWKAFIVAVFKFAEEPVYRITTSKSGTQGLEENYQAKGISVQYIGPVQSIRLKHGIQVELINDPQLWKITNAKTPTTTTALLEQLRQLCFHKLSTPSRGARDSASLIVKLKIASKSAGILAHQPAIKASGLATSPRVLGTPSAPQLPQGSKRTRAQIEALEDDLDKEQEGFAARYLERKKQLNEEWENALE
ncbi:MAG: hypothetical protein Q9210_006192, partial [Variospora velana]